LKSKGVTLSDLEIAYRHQPIPTTKQKERQAARIAIADMVKNEVGYILRQRGVNPQGYNLDHKHLGRTNFVVLASAIHSKINEFVGKDSRSRHEFSKAELDLIKENFDTIVE
jgi:hypothetical protein